jgi:chromosomal replication initiation ATPase DnaA
MQSLQLRLHEERKARLARMGGSHIQAKPLAKISKESLPQVVKLKIEVPENAVKELSGINSWFWLEEMVLKGTKLKLHYILRAVCQFCGISHDDIISDRRTHRFTRPRHLFLHLARELTNATWGEIGKVIKKDHTTVIYGWRRVLKNRADYPEVGELIRRLIREGDG